ncbi:DNA-binding response regulator [Actinoplanes ianthinogenes]|uniref:DNA-binding response regulator n=1 Tax=Actinoplanes ianthinogenes TaxID=122358 RepID=A0ABM7M7B7_9ACTN|nr:response regulator transcription factor [Actinoplanes ianthinogenes]BCJ47559.1 DNA-binding response regulator [Actinoplanes ianthinogenes]GGR02598.1 DNA-binding response regulator [Actinoplanes ianthinogenes]
MIRILLVEPLTMLRGALAATLTQEDDLDVVADLDTLDAALDMARAVSPDVAVINIALLAGAGLTTFARFTAGHPGCATLALAGPDEPVLLNRALDRRVDGVVSTQAAPGELIRGIRRLVRGERVVDATLAVAMVTAPRSPLSAREVSVLSAAASGVPSTEVAAELHLSPGTVRNYISAILRKTGARNRLEAVRLAESCGWLS